MGLRKFLAGRLRLPIIGAPMFRASTPYLVIAECRAGILGAMPSRSVRDAASLPSELSRISQALHTPAGGGKPVTAAPYAINLIVHGSNPRLEHDFACCLNAKVPVIITSLGVSRDIIEQVHGYGGYVLHDITNVRHARKAIDQGVDGLVAVCAGAGGHSGTISPFALLGEIRRFFDGVLVAAGAIATGDALLAALVAGADYGYMGTRFIATAESGVSDEYKNMIARSGSAEIILSSWLTGVSANFLRASVVAAGFDPENMPDRASASVNVATESRPPGWGEFWGAGHGVSLIDDSPAVAELVERLAKEFEAARRRVAALAYPA